MICLELHASSSINFLYKPNEYQISQTTTYLYTFIHIQVIHIGNQVRLKKGFGVFCQRSKSKLDPISSIQTFYHFPLWKNYRPDGMSSHQMHWHVYSYLIRSFLFVTKICTILHSTLEETKERLVKGVVLQFPPPQGLFRNAH